MKVNLKESYEAEQFNPKRGIPKCVIDLLKEGGYSELVVVAGYEWAVKRQDHRVEGIHVGDWIVNNGNERFVFTNEEFNKTFKEVTK